MNKIQHPSNNAVLGAPSGWDQSALECGALAITQLEVGGCPAMVSFWKPTADELADLNAGAAVSLWIYGAAHPPVSVQVEPSADGQVQHGDTTPVLPPASVQVDPLAVNVKEAA